MAETAVEIHGTHLCEREGPDCRPEIPGYEILDEVGRGGMGVVYRARQIELNRIVGLKTIRAGHHAGAAQRQRFRGEAEIVGRLCHPNIVHVYEAGEHDGQAYFSMEFMEGGNLAAKGIWAPADAARMVRTVANAVDEAHRAGVVHRDLKPSNVLLTADGTPKVADFGLARTLAGSANDTETGILLGTPSYIAPEQAAGRAKEAGPTADVYSLGAILYELLTGRPPFKGNSTLETVQLVLGADPLPPRRFQPTVPSDLETICLKCLEKDPSRRYQTARAMAEDLGRFLAGEPILARPVPVWRRGIKWARRRPTAATALALVGLIFLGLGMATVLLTRAYRAERAAKEEALESRAEAELSAREARQKADEANNKARTVAEVVDFLAGLFQASDPIGLEGLGYRRGGAERRPASPAEFLELGRRQLESRLGKEPVVRAAMLDTIGTLYRSTGSFDQAEPMLTEALALRRQHLAWPCQDIADSIFHLGWLRHDQGRFAEAEALYREALKTRRAMNADDDLKTSAVILNLAWVIAHRFDHSSDARLGEAERLFREVIAIRRKFLGENNREVAMAATALACCLFGEKGKWQEGVKELLRADRILESSGDKNALSSTFLTYVQAVTARRVKRYGDSERLYVQILGKARPVLGEHHPLFIFLLGDYAGLLRQAGQLDKAERTLREAIELGRGSPAYWHPAAVDALVELADHVLRHKGDAPAARKLYLEAATVAHAIGCHDRAEKVRKKLEGLPGSQLNKGETPSGRR